MATKRISALWFVYAISRGSPALPREIVETKTAPVIFPWPPTSRSPRVVGDPDDETESIHRWCSCERVLEAIRPSIEAWLLNWITHEPLRRSDFFETANGNCRLMARLCSQLSETAPTWNRAVAPYAEWIAQTLWNRVGKPGSKRNTLPTRLTQRRRIEGRGNDFVLDVPPAPYPQKTCSECGATTIRGRFCPDCGLEVSRAKLIELAKKGRVAAQSPEARKTHSKTQRRHEAAKRAWRSAQPTPAGPDEQAYVEQIQPRLSSITIFALSSALRSLRVLCRRHPWGPTPATSEALEGARTLSRSSFRTWTTLATYRFSQAWRAHPELLLGTRDSILLASIQRKRLPLVSES
jgi:ribosomal protein L32